MKVLFARIVAMAIIPACIFQGTMYLTYDETKITEDEIVIGRVTGFAAATTYAVDRRTGDEKLISTDRVPFLTDRHVIIEYAEVASKFEKAQAIIENARRRYANLIPSY